MFFVLCVGLSILFLEIVFSPILSTYRIDRNEIIISAGIVVSAFKSTIVLFCVFFCGLLFF